MTSKIKPSVCCKVNLDLMNNIGKRLAKLVITPDYNEAVLFARGSNTAFTFPHNFCAQYPLRGSQFATKCKDQEVWLPSIKMCSPKCFALSILVALSVRTRHSQGRMDWWSTISIWQKIVLWNRKSE